MHTLAKQLSKVRKPEDSLYSVDSFQRRSLIHDDPRRVQSIEAYSLCLKHFNSLSKREPCLSRFNSTLFASSSVQLQLTSLREGEKRFIQKEIREILCQLSPLLRDEDTVYSIEWLVHKYRVNEFHLEDMLRCVLPYYETAIFPRFVQLFNPKKLPPQWEWLTNFSSKPVPKAVFLKLCRKNSSLLPFICSSLLAMSESLKEEPLKMNDFSNLFMSTLLDLFSKAKGPVKIAQLVEKIQGTIQICLKLPQMSPLHSAIKVILVRVNEAIDIDHDVLTLWIKLLFKNCPPGKELENLKIVLKLTSKQGLAFLPDKLEKKRLRLIEKLDPSESKIYSELVDEALDRATEVENLPDQALELPEVRDTVDVMDVDEAPEPEAQLVKKPTGRKLRKLVKQMQPSELFGQQPWSNFEVTFAQHDRKCVRNIFHLLHQFPFTCPDPVEQELVTKQRLIHVFKIISEAFENNKQHLLPMLDEALSQLLILLLHPLGKFRLNAVKTVAALLKQSTAKMVNCTTFLQFWSASSEQVAIKLYSQEIQDMLNAEPLDQLLTSLPELSRATLGILARDSWDQSPESWNAAVRLFAPVTLSQIFASDGVIWTQFLTVLRLSKQLTGHVDSAFFYALPLENQKQLLTALLDAGHVDLASLKLQSSHFSFCLELLEARLHFQGQRKPITQRVKQARQTRRSIGAEEDSFLPSTLAYLRGLDALGKVLNFSIPDLHKQHIKSLQQITGFQSVLDTKAPSAFAKLVAQGSKSSAITQSQSLEETLKRKIDHASSALGELIHPIVKQILALTEEERDPAYSRKISDSDSDNGFESDPEAVETISSGPLELRERAGLLKSCIHQMVSSLGLIFAQANAERKAALDAATSQLRKSRHAYKLHQIASRAITEGSIAKAKLCIQPLFLCMEVFPAWSSLQQQILACLIELAALFPVALCEHLMHFLRWVTTSSEGRMMRLQDSHNLALIGRLVSVAIPALVESSRQPAMVALDVLVTFVDNFPALVDVGARRRMAFYCGVIHGLARACTPVNLAQSLELGTLRDEQENRQTLQLMHAVALRTDRQGKKRNTAQATWLWIAATFFSNRDWPDSSIAESVSTFLVKLFSEFPLQTQILSWCQCLAYLLFLVKEEPPSTTQEYAPIRKRPRLAESPASSSGNLTPLRRSMRLRQASTSISQKEPIELGVDLRHVPINKRRRTNSMNEPEEKSSMTGLHTPPLIEIQNLCQDECARLARILSSQNDPQTPPSWPLVSRICHLVQAVLTSSEHVERLQHQLQDNKDLVADQYGRLVYHALRLMTEASKHSSNEQPKRKETLSALQHSLIQVQECVRPSVYIRMLTDLLERGGLTRRVLELLAAKLNHLAHALRRRNSLDLEHGLEETLLELLQRCHALLLRNLGEPQSQVMNALLGCLVHLVQLLGEAHPQPVLKTVEAVLSKPDAWWPQQVDDDTSSANGTVHAEARSLLCQLLLKALDRIGIWLQPRWHSIGPKMLQVAADHCATAARVDDRPKMLPHIFSCPEIHAPDEALCDSSRRFLAGSIHYRDQHLLAGMNLLLAVMEYGMARQIALVDGTSSLDQAAAVTGPFVLFNFKPEMLPMLCHRVKNSSDDSSLTRERMTQLLSGNLLLLLARLSSLDLVAATGCRPERSAVQLSQLHQLMTRLRHNLLQAPGITHLLLSVYTLLKYAIQINDRDLFLGVSHIVTALDNVSESEDKLRSVLTHKPELLFHMSQQLFTHADPGCGAVTTLMRHLPDQELVSHLLKKLITWAPSCRDVGRNSVDMDADLDEVISHVGLILDRLSSLLSIVQQLAPQTVVSSPEMANFVELCRGADLPLFLLDLLTLMTTPRRKQLIKRLSDSSALRDMALLLMEQCPAPANKLDVSHPARWHPESTSNLIVLMLQVLELWLRAEQLEGATSLSSLLAITGNRDVAQVGVAMMALLDLCQDPEEDNMPLLMNPAQALKGPVTAYLDVAMEDEALIRPLCAALCQRLRCSGPEAGGLYGVCHWKTRLAAIDILRIVYEHLLQTDKLGQEALDAEDREARKQKLAVASCTVEEALAGLQEALQDDRVEMEEAANKLFADLQTAGVLSR